MKHSHTKALNRFQEGLDKTYHRSMFEYMTLDVKKQHMIEHGFKPEWIQDLLEFRSLASAFGTMDYYHKMDHEIQFVKAGGFDGDGEDREQHQAAN